MASTIKKGTVNPTATQPSVTTGETRVEVPSRGPERMQRALEFLEREVWPNIPAKFRGRRVTKRERERILG